MPLNLDPDNSLPTPANYATPEQLKSVRDYAKALMTGSGQQPVRHPLMAIGNVVSALVGGNMLYNAGQQERASGLYDTNRFANRIPGLQGQQPQAGPPTPSSFSGGPSTEGQANNAVDAGQSSDVLAAQRTAYGDQIRGNPALKERLAAMMMAEEGDDPQARRALAETVMNRGYSRGVKSLNTVLDPRYYQPDQNGSYAFHLGQLRKDKKYQDAVYKEIEDVLGGSNISNLATDNASGNVKAHALGNQSVGFIGQNGELFSRKDVHPEIHGAGAVAQTRDWYQNTMDAMKGGARSQDAGTPARGPALAFNGMPQEAPAVQAVNASAEGGGTPAPQQVAGKRPQQQYPTPGAQQQYIDPRLAPRPLTNMSPGDLANTLASGYLNDATKATALGLGLQQGQPLTFETPDGEKIVINPNDPRLQQFFGKTHWGETDVGGIKVPQPAVRSAPNSPYNEVPINPPGAAGPRSEAAPVQAPAAAPPAALPAGRGPVQATAENAPVVPASPVNATARGTQVASLDPTAGAVPSTMKPLNTVGPNGIPEGAVPSPAAAEPLARLAQAAAPTLPPGITPGSALDRAFGIYGYKQKLDLQQKEAEARNSKEIETGFKDYEKFSSQASQAQSLIPNVEGSLALLNDPRIHTGMLSGVQDAWSRFKSAFFADEKDANAPNELFDKNASSQVLGIMRATLQGLGQVRLAEINLLTKANASRFYGDGANRAVLEISRSGLEKVAQLGQMAHQYVAGDDVVDPVTGHVLLHAGEGKRHGMDADFNKLAQAWTGEQNKKFSEKMKNYEELFNTGRDKASGTKLWEGNGKEQPSNPERGQPWTFGDGKGGQLPAVFDGKNWVPKDQYNPNAPPPPATPPVSR